MKDRKLNRIEHLIADLVKDYIGRSGQRPIINSAEEIYRVCKPLCAAENLSMAGFFEKICTEAMEKANGLESSRPKHQEQNKRIFFDLNAGVDKK